MSESRKQRRERLRREREIQLRRRMLAGGTVLGILLLLLVLLIAGKLSGNRQQEKVNFMKILHKQEDLLSEEVVEYRDTVLEYAEQEGILSYTPVLMAIMEVETKGTGSPDVMQSSVSGGYPSNSLGPEESIEQACIYFSRLLEIAQERDCDLSAVIQAYNYGPDYLRYVEENGGTHSLELAEQFAGQRADWKTVTYTNPITEDYNDGWRYAYGNMFYELLVRQYLP